MNYKTDYISCVKKRPFDLISSWYLPKFHDRFFTCEIWAFFIEFNIEPCYKSYLQQIQYKKKQIYSLNQKSLAFYLVLKFREGFKITELQNLDFSHFENNVIKNDVRHDKCKDIVYGIHYDIG